jgi:hypothetical protein
MFVSQFQNWLGQTQRVVKIDGDMLHLSSATPIMSGGKKTMSYLAWRRAESNVSLWTSGWRPDIHRENAFQSLSSSCEIGHGGYRSGLCDYGAEAQRILMRRSPDKILTLLLFRDLGAP